MKTLSSPATQEAQHPATPTFLPLALTALIFAGFNLRTILLEVPPILPLIQHDLHLNYTETGLLNSLPPLVLGGAAYPAAIFIGRLGARLAMTLALASMSLLSLLRMFAPDAFWLFAVTALMSLGIALGQTAVPMLVHERFPRFVGQVTAAYSTGLMVGEIVAASFTASLVLPLFAQHHWRGTFLFWSFPVVLSLVLWLWWMPRSPAVPRATVSVATPVVRAAASVRQGRVWVCSLILGCGSLLFFGMDTWIPVYFQHMGSNNGTLALVVLTVAQLPASLALTAWGQHIAGRKFGFLVGGGVASLALILWFIAPIGWDVVLAGVVGAASAWLFVLGLSLPPYLARGNAVAEVSGVMLSIGYLMAFVGPFLGGLLWDNTHIAITAFIPILVACLAVVGLATFMPDLRKDAAHG
jgi:CP family cyanate transporter-like MFS transporter